MNVRFHITKARRSNRRHARMGDWAIAILIGLSLWFVHFGKAVDYDNTPYPAMNSAFELLFVYGRPLALSCMVFALALFIALSGRITSKNFRGGASWVAALNFYLSAKLLFLGQGQFFIEATIVITLTVLSIVLVMSDLEARSMSKNGFCGSPVALSVWIFAFLLVTTNIVALFFYPDAALGGGRMHGTTVNPQHLGMMCALASPATFYAIQKFRLISIIGAISAALLMGIVIIEYQTGSRMGFAAVGLGAAIAMRDWIAGQKTVVGIFVVISLVGIGLVYGDVIVKLIASQFIEGREDTRSEAWKWAWRAFLDNPLFGVAPELATGRWGGFVENFWLAAASTGGIVALVLAMPIFISLVRIAQLLQFTVRNRLIERSLGSFYLSAAVILFGISFFEAVLLGIFAAHTMLAYLYFAGAAAVISPVHRQKRLVFASTRQHFGRGR